MQKCLEHEVALLFALKVRDVLKPIFDKLSVLIKGYISNCCMRHDCFKIFAVCGNVQSYLQRCAWAFMQYMHVHAHMSRFAPVDVGEGGDRLWSDIVSNFKSTLCGWLTAAKLDRSSSTEL